VFNLSCEEHLKAFHVLSGQASRVWGTDSIKGRHNTTLTLAAPVVRHMSRIPKSNPHPEAPASPFAGLFG